MTNSLMTNYQMTNSSEKAIMDRNMKKCFLKLISLYWFSGRVFKVCLNSALFVAITLKLLRWLIKAEWSK